jgi:lipopolysaccharide transport system permease protein
MGASGMIHVHYEGGKPPSLRYLSPRALIDQLWRHRALLHQLSSSRFSAGHREDVLGMAWLLLEPLAMLAVFSIVFLVIFRMHWPGTESKPIMRVLCLYAGIVTYQMFAQSVGAAADMVRSARGYVKLMVFPTEVLPASVVGGMLIPSIIGFGLILVTAAVSGVPVRLTVLFLPIVLIPMCLFVLGLAWFLSALCAFVPDVRTLTALAVRFGFFLTPIVYPLDPSRLSNTMCFLLRLNPLSTVVVNVRRVLVFGQMPEWLYLGAVTLGAAVVCQLGFAFFMRSKRWFADVV